MLKYLRNHMRGIMIVIVIAFLASSFLMYDLGRSRSGEAPSVSPDGRLQDYVVASVNGHELRRSDLEVMVRNYIQQSNIRELTPEDIPHLYQATLDNAIFQMELDREVNTRNIDISEEEITSQVNIMADHFPTREAFFQSVERSGVRMEDLRRDIRRRLAMEKTVESYMAEHVVVSDDAVYDFYDALKGLFYTAPRGFTFDFVVLSYDRAAEDLQAKLSEDSARWHEIISEFPLSSDIIRQSTEPSFFSEAGLSADVVMSYMIDIDIEEVGPVTEVGANEFMIVIKREDLEETVRPFDEVSMDIREMLEGQQQRVAFERFRNELIARAVVEIFDHSLFPAPVTDSVGDAPPGIPETTEHEPMPDATEPEPLTDAPTITEPVGDAPLGVPETTEHEPPDATEPELLTDAPTITEPVGNAPPGIPETEPDSVEEPEI